MVINRDRKWTGSRRKISKSCSDDWHRWSFWSAFRHFGTHFAVRFCMSESSWMKDPTRARKMPSFSAIDLTEIRRSSKFSSWIWSIISWVVNVLCRPGRGASQVEKSPRLNWATHHRMPLFYTMVHIPLMFLSEWREFLRYHALHEKINLMTDCVSMSLKSRASPDMLPFSLCNKKRLAIRLRNRPLFPTTLSIPSYDIGK